MPTYEFKCNRCGYKFEVFTSIRLRRKTTCPKCKTPDITQILGNFYLTAVRRVMRESSGSSCDTCSATTCSTCSVKR